MTSKPRPVRQGEATVGEVSLIADGIVFADAYGPDLDVDAARAFRAEAAALAGTPYAIVGDVRKLGFVQRETREWGASDAENEPVATAFVADSAVLEFLGHQFRAMARGRRPVEVFTEEGPALEWARQQLAAHEEANAI